MIPVLYEKNETRFLNYGLGEIDFTFVDVERERNGIYTFYGEYPSDGRLANELIEERQIKSDAGKRTKWQTFVIDRVNRKAKDVIKVYGVHVSQTTAMMSLTPVVAVPSGNATVALNVWKSNLQGNRQFDVWSDISTIGSTKWEAQSVKSARQALGGVAGSILDIWGGEYEFDNNLIRLHQQMGRNTPTTIEYGRNIKDAEVDKQITNTITSIVPYAVYYDNENLEEDETGEQVYIWLDEVVIHGPHRDKWAYDRVQPVDFSSEFDYDEIPTQAKLRSLGESYVERNNIGVPRTKITLEMVDLANTLDYKDVEIIEEVELCDILPVYYSDLGITDNQAKVSATRFNALLNEYISVSIGVVGEGFTSSIRNEFQDSLALIEQRTKAIGNRVPYLINSLGQRVWYETPESNMEHKVGDTWFEKNGNYHKIHVWDGQRWELIIDTEDTDKISRKIDEAKSSLGEEITGVGNRTENAIAEMMDDWEEFRDSLDLDIPDMGLIWNIVGDDGRWVYSDNRLFVMGQHDNDVTSNEVVVTLEDGEKVFTHNGEGFSIGNNYTFSFANPRFVERPNAALTVRRNVDPKQVSNITVDCHYPLYPDYTASNSNQVNTFNKCYHQIYTVTAASAWYETQSVEVDITQNETVTLPVVYKTGTLTVTHNDATLEVV